MRFGKIALRASIIAATMIGLVVALGTIEPLGLVAIGRCLESIGWIGFLLYGLYSLSIFVVIGAAWLMVMGERWRWLPAFVWARVLREAASDLLPFSQIGGIVVGADSLIARGLAGASVYAAITADLATELASQALFTLLGIGLFTTAWLGRADGSLRSAAIVSVVGMALIGVIARLAPRWLPRVAPMILRGVMPGSLAAVNEVALRLGQMFSRRARVLGSTILNFTAWTLSAIGAWIVLQFMGADLPLTRVLSLEAFIFAIRSVAFMVPGGIGVQEAAYALSAPMFGLPIEAAVVLAIAKRCKDLAIGLPVLIVWQMAETRNVVRMLRRPGPLPTRIE
jgi:putative membrane protein